MFIFLEMDLFDFIFNFVFDLGQQMGHIFQLIGAHEKFPRI